MTSGVFLLLLAALTCGLARAEEPAAEELQVETLVSVCVFLFFNTPGQRCVQRC